MARIAWLFPVLAFLAIACSSTPPKEARVEIDEERTQIARFEKYFNAREGLWDLVLVTRDFREELALVEHTTLLAYRGGKYSALDVVTYDRKFLGKTKVRNVLAGLWPVDLRDDPTNRSLLFAEATADFFTDEVAKSSSAAGLTPGIDSLEVTVRFVDLQKDGTLRVREPKTGEIGRGISQLLAADEEKRPPLHWTLLLQFYLAERNKEAEETAKAAAAYQRVADTVSHKRDGPEGDEMESGVWDLRNVDYIAHMANKRILALK